MKFKYYIILPFLIPLLVMGCTTPHNKDKESIGTENKEATDSLISKAGLSETDNYPFWYDNSNNKALQELGFEYPEEDILANLLSSDTLVQDDAVLGGTMQIDYAMLVGTSNALACASDGHIILYYFLEYRVKDKQQIDWKILSKSNPH